MNSHVQNSKTIINNFRISKSNGNTNSINLDKKIIETDKGPRQIGVLKNYFDKSTEKYLSDRYEKPIGDVVSTLKVRESNSKASFLLSESEITAIKRYLTMLMVREPALIDKVFNNSIIAKTLGLMPTPSCFVKLLEKTNLVDFYFNQHYPVVEFNKTKTSYISSIKGFYVFGGPTIADISWWFPITPTISICFASKKCFSEVYQNSFVIDMYDKSSIQFNNKKMLDAAIKQKNKYVFSNDVNELNRLLNSIK